MSKCTCGRSPSGNCVGWHNLNEKDYKTKLSAYNEKKKKKK